MVKVLRDMTEESQGSRRDSGVGPGCSWGVGLGVEEENWRKDSLRKTYPSTAGVGRWSRPDVERVLLERGTHTLLEPPEGSAALQLPWPWTHGTLGHNTPIIISTCCLKLGGCNNLSWQRWEANTSWLFFRTGLSKPHKCEAGEGEFCLVLLVWECL